MGGAEPVEIARQLRERFAATAAEHDRDRTFPFANVEALREAGLLSLTIPREFGGQGAGVATSCRVIEQIAAGEASTALVFAWQLIVHGVAARGRSWEPAIYERLAREGVERGAMLNYMRVEPELGTPSRGGMPSTTATATEGGWRLTGHKMYCTGAPVLGYYLVWAKTAEPEPRVGYFAVPRTASGITMVETWDHLGMRASGTHDLIFEETPFAADLALDIRVPGAAQTDSSASVWNNLVLSALYSGVAKAARDWLAQYLKDRVPTNLGAPLASLPRHQSVMGEIEALLFTNDRLIFGLADDLEAAGYPFALASKTSLAKYVATNNAVRAIDLAMSLVGNPGLSRTNPLERHHRDVLCSRIHMPQDDITLLLGGKAALGVA